MGGWDLTGLCSSYMYKFDPFKGLQKFLTLGWAPVPQLCAELLGAALTPATPHRRVSSHGNHFCSTLRSVTPIPICLKRRKRISYAVPTVFFCASKLLVAALHPMGPREV